MDICRQEEAVDPDNNLQDTLVLQKYQLAADIANGVLHKLRERTLQGANIHKLCRFGDQLILAYCAQVFKKNDVEKGIAFPTTICVNGVAENFAPIVDETSVLVQGDVVKVELGVHIDGYISTAAHTTVVLQAPNTPLTGRAADVVCAAHYAFEAAIRTIKPGHTSRDVVRVVRQSAAHFKCTPIVGPAVTQIRRFITVGEKCVTIPNLNDEEDLNIQEQDLEEDEDVIFQAGEAYTVDIQIGTAESGLLVESSDGIRSTTIFKRDVNSSYNLKLQASRRVFNEVRDRFGVFPFSVSSFNDNRTARLGMPECINHGVLEPIPVLTCPKPATDLTARFKTTILLQPIGTTNCLRLNPSLPPPYVHSAYSVPVESQVGSVLAKPVEECMRVRKVGSDKMINEIGARVVAEVSGLVFGVHESTEMDVDIA